MNKHYSLTDLDGTVIGEYSRKDGAIKAAQRDSLVSYRVLSPAGAVVLEVTPEPSEETVEADLPADEDLLGETSTEDPEPKPSTKFNLADMKSKIAKLLNKAEGTDNEEERDAFTAKAEKLMLQLGIRAAELEATGSVKPEDIVEVHRDFPGNYSIAMIPFAFNVTSGFGDLTMLQSNRPGLTRRAHVIGHKSDVEMCTQLLDSLSLQVMAALKFWQKANIESRRGLTDMEKYVQHRSFITGFGREVGDRLRSLRKSVVEEEASTGAALVLASKPERVKSWMDENYPKLGKGRGGMQTWSSIASSAGRDAGKSANLGGKAVGGKKGEIK